MLCVMNVLLERQLLSLSILIPNSRDQLGWLPNSLENNLTITYPSNTGHISLSTELLA